MQIWFYDTEVFRHNFIFVFVCSKQDQRVNIVDNPKKLKEFMAQHKGDIFIGYNSRWYDQYLIKAVLCDENPWDATQHIIAKGKHGWEFSNKFSQVRINNFDIMTTRTHSLKELEAMMGQDIIESPIPFDLDRPLTRKELKQAVEYCYNDVLATIQVCKNRKEEFTSQYGLIKQFNLPLHYIGKTKAQLSSIILDAKRPDVPRDDEFDLLYPNTLQLENYRHILDWYDDPVNHDYEKELKVEVSGIEHTFAWGGLHAGKKHCVRHGMILNCDVASYYPALMIEYGYLSRNVKNKEKYRTIRDMRLHYKKMKDPRANPLKIILNSTFGASKDVMNSLYDPRQTNNICVGGQLLLLDLIEKLEPYWELLQSNTDGIMGYIEDEDNIPILQEIFAEWQERTRMVLEFEECSALWQKDVNNYILQKADGSLKSKGAYVKKLSNLDYHLPIVNEALVRYFTEDIPIEDTVYNCNELIKFQFITKISAKFENFYWGDKKLPNRCVRVFASTHPWHHGLSKLKIGRDNPEKVAGTPEKCFIDNSDVRGRQVGDLVDREWYIAVAQKRLNDFLGIRKPRKREKSVVNG